jgi:hypothetical protein
LASTEATPYDAGARRPSHRIRVQPAIERRQDARRLLDHAVDVGSLPIALVVATRLGCGQWLDPLRNEWRRCQGDLADDIRTVRVQSETDDLTDQPDIVARMPAHDIDPIQ